jgi:2-methylcitrate dehydratase PrpD
MATLSRTISEFICAMRPAELPAEVREDVRWRVFDTLGVALAGARMEYASMVANVAADMGGKAEATTFAFGNRLPAPLAGYVNAALVHGPDYDDTHSTATLHPSCFAVPAAFAASERVGASGAECLTAVALAAEIALRIGHAVPPHYFSDRGFHPVGLMGPFGAAAAGAYLFRLDEDQTAHALGIAGTQHVGLMQQLLDGSWVKRLYPAAAVQAGLTACLLAKQGFTGPSEILEGRFGFYRTLTAGDEGVVDAEAVVRGLGDTWLYPDTVYKIYPSGSATHAPMDLARELFEREHLQYEEIERVDCFMSPDRVAIVGEPRAVRLQPRTPYHIKFSLPYCIAMLLVFGHADSDDFSDATLADPRVAAVAQRVFCIPDAKLGNEKYPARVMLTCRDGRRLELAAPAQRGTRDRPLTRDQHRAKFMRNARPLLGEEAARALQWEVEGAWTADTVNRIVQLESSDLPLGERIKVFNRTA